jgi:hypothetical protein
MCAVRQNGTIKFMSILEWLRILLIPFELLSVEVDGFDIVILP